MRTARDLTSGENRFVVGLLIAPSSQRLEPPANPARFTSAVLGLIFHDAIKTYLFSPWVVVATMFLGGIAILIIERVQKAFRYQNAERLPLGVSLLIGCC